MEQLYPPICNIEVEEAILGGIILDPYAIGRVASILKTEAFFLESHATIYHIALTMHRDGVPIDLLTLTDRLKERGLYEHIGKTCKLVQLLDRTVCAVNIDSHAKVVMDKYCRRQLVSIGNELTAGSRDRWCDMDEEIDRTILRLQQLQVASERPSNTCSLGEILARPQPSKQKIVSTGIKEFDSLLDGGFAPEDLNLICATSGTGKTWFAIYLAYQAAKAGKPVLFLSGEMSAGRIGKRFRKLAGKKASDLPIYIDDTDGAELTPERVRAILDRHCASVGTPRIIMLDYLQLMGDRSSGNRAQTLEAYTGGLKAIAKKYDLSIVLLAQLHIPTRSQSDKTPTMGDLRNSQGPIQDADKIILLHKPHSYDRNADPRSMQIIADKHRDGVTNSIWLNADLSCGKFSPCQAVK